MDRIVAHTSTHIQDFSVLDFLALSTKVFGPLCVVQFNNLNLF